MNMPKSETLMIDSALRSRLTALAEREGASFPEFAERLLRSHADEAERAIVERAEDEQRWQRYIETGAAVPFETVRSKLAHLAGQAAQKMEPQ